MNYTDAQIEALIAGIFNGTYTEKVLPADLYYAIADYLKRGLYEGLKMSLSEAVDTTTYDLVASLRENVYIFSGAKTFQTVRAMESMLTEDGRLRTSKEFYKVAVEEYKLFNKVWAESEYTTAVGQADAAIKWHNIEQDADIFPYLEYSAVVDPVTSAICRPLNGIIAPVKDPIWDRVSPLNHYNCRCVLLQRDSGRKSKGADKTVKAVEETMQDAFKMNPGKTGEVFSKEHPYFENVPKAQGKNNFGFDIPKTD